MKPESQLTYRDPFNPWPVRSLNAIARSLRPISDKSVSLKARDLLAKACRKTGLADWGHPSALQALEASLDSVQREGQLSYFGRFALRQFLIAKLCNRLRIIEALRRFPQITRQEIRRPVFITGWYRSGTTYLHNLLAAHPQSRAPLYWELTHPCPAVDPGSVEPRKLIHKTKLANHIHRYLAPGFNQAHSMPAEKPEECLHLFENAGMGTTAFFITEAKSVAWWLLDQNFNPGYRFYRDQIKILNWLRPGRRWVLKWPFHLWHLDALLDVFPDATGIHIHRHPQEAIASVCNLAALAREPFCDRIDNHSLGQFWLDYNDEGLRRGLASRTKSASDRIIDVCYTDLVANAFAEIQRILDRIGIERDEAWLNSLPTGRQKAQTQNGARHQFILSQFGLDVETVNRRFADYIKTYELEA